MKPNTELNTMMFFDDALEGERTQLLTELADAVSETRTAADQAAELNEDGEAGLLRLTEIWCAMNGVPAIVIFEGGQSELLANVVAQIYSMRIKPSLVPSGKFYYTLGDTQRTTTATATAHSANVNRAIIKCAITETGILTGTISPQGDIDISADL